MTSVLPSAEPPGSAPARSATLRSRWESVRDRVVDELRTPVDAASIAVFRMAFGAILVWEVYRYLSSGWVRSLYTEPDFHFTYLGFGWVQPLPSPYLETVFVLLGVLGAGFAVGLAYRVCAVGLFLGFSYVFLLDQAMYLNHMYLVCLLLFLACFIPMNRLWSVDAALRPDIASDRSPAGWLWLLRFQLAVVYFFAGVAKLNADWLLRGQPIAVWWSDDTHLPIVGPFLRDEWMIYFLAWSGAAFDLLVAPALLWRRTRWFALAAAILFNVMNHGFFNIGIFPWFAIAATTLFLMPGWPRAVLRFVTRERVGPATTLPRVTAGPVRRTIVLSVVGVYVAAQLILPVRHWAIPGDVAWTDEGHRYAWRMKLRTKQAEAQFFVTNPETGEVREIDPDPYLTDRQERVMSSKPDMVAQFARHLAELEAQAGRPGAEVRADIRASLNFGPEGQLVTPDVDLADTSPWVVVQPWATRYPPERTDRPDWASWLP